MLSLNEAVAALPPVRYVCFAASSSDSSAIREFVASEVPEGGGDELPVPPRKVAKRVRGVWAGGLWRSEPLMEYVRSCKATRAAVAEKEAADAEVKPVLSVWNDQRLRAGDRIGGNIGLPESEDTQRRNQYQPGKVLELAWMQVGGIKSIRAGVDGMAKELAAIGAVSALTWDMQQLWARQQLDILKRDRTPIVICKHYDATPRAVTFGAARDAVMPHARYPAWNDAEAKWDMLTFTEYLKRYPGRSLTRGTVDILATGFEIRYADPGGLLHGVSLLTRPQALANGSAGVVHEALEQAMPPLAEHQMHDLASDLPWVVIQETPDACAAMRRKISYSAQKLSGIPNVLHSDHKCGAHQIFRIVVSKERLAVGDCHAAYVSFSNVGHQTRLQAELRKACQHTQIIFAAPPPEFAARNRMIALHTFARTENCVEGDFVEGDFLSACSDSNFAKALERFLKYWNGDWTLGRIQHYAHPSEDLAALPDVMCSVALNIGIFLQHVKQPCLDDWQTTGPCCGVITGGMLCHNVIPQIFQAAFQTWSDMAPEDENNGDQDAIAEMRLQTQKKAWRTKKMFESCARRSRIMLVCFIATPLESLHVDLAELDNHGAGLFDFVFSGATNPLEKAKRRLADICHKGHDGPLGYVLHGVPLDERQSLIQSGRQMCSEFGGQLWWRFKDVTEFPCRWSSWAHPCATLEQKAALLDDMFIVMKPCCRSKAFCQKIVDRFGAPEQLAEDVIFKRVIHTWARTFKHTDLIMERLLSRYRAYPGPEKWPLLERITSCGFVGQVMATHMANGGADP